MSRPVRGNFLGTITLGLHLGWRIAGLAVAAAGALRGGILTMVHNLIAVRKHCMRQCWHCTAPCAPL